MSCEYVRELISLSLDGQLPAQELEKMSAHLRACRQCSSSLATGQELRSAMRTMARIPAPSKLSAKLRVIASHEHHRRVARATVAGRIGHWLAPVQLLFDNLMRPMALPFAGGVFSALVLFSALMPNLMFHHGLADSELYTSPDGEVVIFSSNGAYVPGGLTDVWKTKPPAAENILRIDRVEVAAPDDANVVELSIDANGRVVDWSVMQGTLTPDLQSIIMLSQFTPATFLGLPTASKMKAVQRIAATGHRMRS